MKIILFLAVLATAVIAQADSPMHLLSGCQPDKVSRNVIRIAAGVIGDTRGLEVFVNPVRRELDLTVIGPWGADAPITTGDLCLYVIRHESTGEKAVIASQSQTFGGIVYPAGWEFFRKLPWGCVYNLAWDGIPNFHLAGWPSPYIRLTDSQYGAPWVALAAGASETWATIDLSPWLPDNARLAEINTEVRYGGGSAGSAYIRSHGGQAVGLFVGSANPSAGSFTSQRIRVTSTRRIEYRVTAGARLYIYVTGYFMTEPS